MGQKNSKNSPQDPEFTSELVQEEELPLFGPRKEPTDPVIGSTTIIGSQQFQLIDSARDDQSVKKSSGDFKIDVSYFEPKIENGKSFIIDRQGIEMTNESMAMQQSFDYGEKSAKKV